MFSSAGWRLLIKLERFSGDRTEKTKNNPKN
jgi:hypothetical protein